MGSDVYFGTPEEMFCNFPGNHLKLTLTAALCVTLLGLPWMAGEAVAQSQQSGDTQALSAGVRTALARTGGGRVLSAERISSGGEDLSRVKVVDPRGRLQVLMIEDHSRPRGLLREPEEAGRRNRFSPRGDMDPATMRLRSKPRSNDVQPD